MRIRRRRPKRVALASLLKEVKVNRSLRIRLQDVPSGISALRHVMHNAFGDYPSESSHSSPSRILFTCTAEWSDFLLLN